MPVASNITMTAKIAETAKRGSSNPTSKATAVVNAVTAAEWELGIPPVDVMSFQSSLRVNKKLIGIFTNCAKRIANNAARSGTFWKMAIGFHSFTKRVYGVSITYYSSLYR